MMISRESLKEASMISIPLTKIKARISALAERLINLKESIVIIKHGKSLAMLMSCEDLKKIEPGGRKPAFLG